MKDDGLTIGQVVTAAWLLGAGALIVAFRLLAYKNDPPDEAITIVLWAFVGGLAAVASAACAVVTAVKAAEARLEHHLTSVRAEHHSERDEG